MTYFHHCFNLTALPPPQRTATADEPADESAPGNPRPARKSFNWAIFEEKAS
jgi:hypothetical protein